MAHRKIGKIGWHPQNAARRYGRESERHFTVFSPEGRHIIAEGHVTEYLVRGTRWAYDFHMINDVGRFCTQTFTRDDFKHAELRNLDYAIRAMVNDMADGKMLSRRMSGGNLTPAERARLAESRARLSAELEAMRRRYEPGGGIALMGIAPKMLRSGRPLTEKMAAAVSDAYEWCLENDQTEAQEGGWFIVFNLLDRKGYATKGKSQVNFKF